MLSEMLFEQHYGAVELARQRPLLVFDKSTYWRVEGSWNRDYKDEGESAVFLSLRKYDGQVSDFGRWRVFHPDPRARAIIEAHRRRERGD
jgi:hypothetical protein